MNELLVDVLPKQSDVFSRNMIRIFQRYYTLSRISNSAQCIFITEYSIVFIIQL